jgi:hypothetical protein
MSSDVQVDEQIERALVGLRQRYTAAVGEDKVEAAIDEAIHHFAGARVRDHLPVLIERRAKATLERAA